MFENRAGFSVNVSVGRSCQDRIRTIVLVVTESIHPLYGISQLRISGRVVGPKQSGRISSNIPLTFVHSAEEIRCCLVRSPACQVQRLPRKRNCRRTPSWSRG